MKVLNSVIKRFAFALGNLTSYDSELAQIYVQEYWKNGDWNWKRITEEVIEQIEYDVYLCKLYNV